MRLCFQCVHSRDVGEAFAQAALSDVRGGVNIAADPTLDPETLADVLDVRRVRIPALVLRQGVQAAWHLRLTPVDRGWVDLALGVPVMSTEKARNEMGFSPRISSKQALLELMNGLRRGTGMDSVPLRPQNRSI